MSPWENFWFIYRINITRLVARVDAVTVNYWENVFEGNENQPGSQTVKGKITQSHEGKSCTENANPVAIVATDSSCSNASQGNENEVRLSIQEQSIAETVSALVTESAK